jgi:hypothetical protein
MIKREASSTHNFVDSPKIEYIHECQSYSILFMKNAALPGSKRSYALVEGLLTAGMN